MTTSQPITWRETKNPYAYKEYAPTLYTDLKRLAGGRVLVIAQPIKRIPRWTIQTPATYKLSGSSAKLLATFKTLEAAKLAYRMLPKNMPLPDHETP